MKFRKNIWIGMPNETDCTGVGLAVFTVLPWYIKIYTSLISLEIFRKMTCSDIALYELCEMLSNTCSQEYY